MNENYNREDLYTAFLEGMMYAGAKVDGELSGQIIVSFREALRKIKKKKVQASI